MAYTIYDFKALGPLRNDMSLPLPRITSLGEKAALSVRQRVRSLPERGAQSYSQGVEIEAIRIRGLEMKKAGG